MRSISKFAQFCNNFSLCPVNFQKLGVTGNSASVERASGERMKIRLGNCGRSPGRANSGTMAPTENTMGRNPRISGLRNYNDWFPKHTLTWVCSADWISTASLNYKKPLQYRFRSRAPPELLRNSPLLSHPTLHFSQGRSRPKTRPSSEIPLGVQLLLRRSGLFFASKCVGVVWLSRQSPLHLASVLWYIFHSSVWILWHAEHYL